MRPAYFLPLLVVVAVYLGYLTKEYDLDTAGPIDLEKFQGTWYEIAALPDSFNKKCSSNIHHTYTLREGGGMDVLSKCIDDSIKVIRSEGRLWLEDSDSKGDRLELSYIPYFKEWEIFGSDHYILMIDIKYRFVLVGSADQKHVRILARDPHIKDVVYKRLREQAKELRFDLSDLTKTLHKKVRMRKRIVKRG